MTHKGTAGFIALRASAVLLLPFVLWFIYAAVVHSGDGYDEMRAWLVLPLTALMMGVLIVLGAFHMYLGMNEIIDDYALGGLRGVWKLFNLFACLGAAIVGVWGLVALAG